MRSKINIGEKLYIFFCYFLIIVLCITILYPFIYMVSASLSSTTAVMRNKVVLWPVEFTAEAYRVVAQYKGIWTAYGNTIFYTVVGTLINLAFTILAARAAPMPLIAPEPRYLSMLSLSAGGTTL